MTVRYIVNIYRIWTNKSLCVLVDEKKGTLQLFFIAHKFPWSHPIIGALDSTEQKNLKVSQKASQYLQQFPTRELIFLFSIPKSGCTAAGSASSNRPMTGRAFLGETRYRRVSDALPWNRSAKFLLFWYFFFAAHGRIACVHSYFHFFNVLEKQFPKTTILRLLFFIRSSTTC